ncbi:hypothetical protein FGO68_gene14526 [Halteria grandinella]|uniref:Cilia- and flagella-associated protein 418 n=1 Tax=Halteria grandinella TaxID=5974 RepID=A0A8J8T6R6_HALGN|nr:hypothetical protein FGO68_gene14526 [Halteria grandinella]
MNLDDLLEEFKDGAKKQGKAVPKVAGGAHPLQRQVSDWDDESESPKKTSVALNALSSNPMNLYGQAAKPVAAQGKAQDDPWGDFQEPKKSVTTLANQDSSKRVANGTGGWDDEDEGDVQRGFGAVKSEPQQKKQYKKDKDDDDLDDLLNDFQGSKKANGAAQQAYTYSIPTSVQQKAATVSGSCYPLFIGGSSLKSGITQSSISPQSCSSLHCLSCDKPVHHFPGNKWRPHVDYLFVRNHNTNIKELVKGLEPSPAYAAYSCQCQWLALCETSATEAEKMNWICGGHK